MNKLFTKIAALFLGMTMAVGVGVAVGGGNRFNQVKANSSDGVSTSIVFKSNSSDSSSAASSLDTNNLVDSNDLMASAPTLTNIYAGKNGAKFGTGSKAGTFKLTLKDDCKTNIKTIKFITAKYSSDTGTFTFKAGSDTLKSGQTPGVDYTHTFDSATTVSDLTISTSSNRGYLKSITVTYESSPTPPTGDLDAPVISISDNTVSWEAVDNATSYTYTVLDSDSETAKEGTTTTTSVDVTDLGLDAGNYSMTVVAKANGYTDSEPSNSVNFTIEATPSFVYGYSDKGTTWQLTNCEDKTNYWLVPSTQANPSIATLTDIFKGKIIKSDVVIKLEIATYGSGANPSSSNFGIYNSDECTTQVTATSSGTFPSSGDTYKTAIYTVTKANALANFTNDLAIKIVKTSGRQIRLKTITVEFKYEEDTTPSITLSTSAVSGTTGDNFTVTAEFANLTSDFAWADPTGSGSLTDTSVVTTENKRNGNSVYSGKLGDAGSVTLATSGGGVSPAPSVTFTIEAPTTIDHVDITTKPTSPVTDKTVGNTFTFGATATRAAGSGESTFTWASTDTSVATIDAETGELTYVGNGTTTISAQSNYPAATGKTNVGTFVLEVENLKGSVSNPLTVEEGRGIAQPATEETTLQYYTTGIISAVQAADYDADKGYKTIWITSDGVDDESRELQAYHAYYLNNQKMTEEQFNSIEDGDTVVIFGKFQNYNSGTLEITSCYIYSHEKPAASTYTVTYNSNGGTGEMTDENSPYDAGSEVTVLANTFTKAGYTFNHWNTASNDSGTSYNAGDTFTINANTTLYAQWTEVVEPGDWVLTSLADLTSEDVFVIVGNNGSAYAMSNNNGTSAPTVVSVTVEDNEITSTVTNSIKWTISGDATDGYTFYPNGSTETWLYCTNSNNGVRVGTGDAKHFTLSDGGYLTTSETTDQRYIGIYNSQDWRCYTSPDQANIKGQTFAFYKYVSDTPTPVITIHTQTNDSYYVDDYIEDFVTIENGNISDVTFTSTNDEVAEVTDGILCVYAEGNTTITASYPGAETQTAVIHAYNLLVSGAVDNVKGDFFVEDQGTLVVKVPEGYDKFLGATNDGQAKFLAAGTGSTYDPLTKTVTCSFEVSATSEIENLSVEFYFGINGQVVQKVITKTLHIINPTGLDAARAFAGSINACCGSGSDMSDLWEMLADDWAGLSEAAKSFLINAHYDVTGTGDQTVVTKHGDTHNELALAMSRYDFMVEHYGMTNFMNKSGLSTGGRVVINPFVSMGENSNMVAIVVIVSVVSLTAIGGYFFLKKRREQN